LQAGKARSSRSLRRRCLYLRRLASSNTLTLFFRERSQRRDDRSLTGQKPTLRSDRRHRAVSAWRRAGGRGVDLRYLRQLRMALHRLLGRWTWRLPNRADVQTICQDRGSIRSRACINRLRSSQSDTAAGLVPEPVAIFWRVSRLLFGASNVFTASEHIEPGFRPANAKGRSTMPTSADQKRQPRRRGDGNCLELPRGTGFLPPETGARKGA